MIEKKINHVFSLQISLYFKLKILLKLPKLIIVCSKNEYIFILFVYNTINKNNL